MHFVTFSSIEGWQYGRLIMRKIKNEFQKGEILKKEPHG